MSMDYQPEGLVATAQGSASRRQTYTWTPMRERRRAGAAVVPKTRPPADRALLQPPAEKPSDHQYDSWRVLRFVSEFVEGFDVLADIGPAVTCFGSARVSRDRVINHRLCRAEKPRNFVCRNPNHNFTAHQD